MDTRDIQSTREDVEAIRAWIIHWREDARRNFTPTESSMVLAELRCDLIKDRLALVDREQKDAA